MNDNRDAQPGLIDGFRASFLNCLRIAYAIFDERAFRIKNEKGKWKHSVPLFDALMVSIEELKEHERKLISNRAKIRAALHEALRDRQVYEIVIGKPNSATAVKNRLTIIRRLLERFC